MTTSPAQGPGSAGRAASPQGGRRSRLGSAVRERSLAGRRAPSILDWALASVLLLVGLLEVAGGVFPGPVGVAAVIEAAMIVPVAFRCVAPVRAIAVSAVASLPFLFAYGVEVSAGGSVANAAVGLLLIYSVGRHADGRRLLAGIAVDPAHDRRAGRRPAGHPLRRCHRLLPVRRGPGPRGGAAGRGGAFDLAGRRGRARPARAGGAARPPCTRSGHASRASCTTSSPTRSGSSSSRPAVLAACSRPTRIGPCRAPAGRGDGPADAGRDAPPRRHPAGGRGPREPLPRLERLPALIDEARAAGLQVDLDGRGPGGGAPGRPGAGSLPACPGGADERAQARAAPSVRIRLGYEPDRLRIEVSDDGAAPAPPARPRARPAQGTA